MMQLPIRAKLRLQAMIDGEQMARDTVSSVTRRLSELSHAMQTAPSAEAANIEHEVTRLREKLDTAQRKYKAAADLLAQVKHWVSCIPANASLEDAKLKVKLAPNETLSTVIANIRGRIAAIRTERIRILQAPPPKADIKLKAREYCEALIEKGRPRIIANHEEAPFAVKFESMVAGAWTAQQDIAAAMCWLDPAAFAKRLNSEIDAMPQNEFSLSHRERMQRLRLAEQDLFELERSEELLILQGEEDGPIIIARRFDADPAAILGVVIVTRGAKTEAELIKKHGGPQAQGAA
jgi:hypothetical protein